MAVEGGQKCVKFLLFFFNFLFWLCGLAVIIVGIVVQVTMNNTIVMKNASGSAAPIVLIVVGFVIFFVSFFGCCGAWKENHCMVTTFAVFLSIIILAEIGIAIAGYVFRGKLNDILDDQLKDLIIKYNSSKEIRKTMDSLQTDLKCCGLNSSSDWKTYLPDGNSVPDSCCKNQTAGCGKGSMLDGNKVYQEGCQPVLKTQLETNMKWVIVGALVIAVIQIMGIVFACMLMKGIRSGYEVM
ncbi:CD63 antigen [Brienomyrus brachyistius]|uniref:CD63 antigen n=1 Tax=Brienomyrus brachyistius TaxID=42636 RepID=UPI0020B37EF6|nr:CD63 antigen [Brienomyrus brachyistius]